MKGILNYLKSKWLFYFIALQPIVDLIAYFQTKVFGTSYSWIIRFFGLITLTVVLFIKSKNKKRLFFSCLPFGIFLVLHIFNLYRINSLNLILDLKYFILVFQMPIITIFLIDYVKEHKESIEMIKKGIIGSILVIAIIEFLSYITNSYEITYEYSKTGIIGWFTGSNTPSMILCALCPWALYYSFSKKNNYFYVIMCIVAFSLLYFNATKACYITLVTSFVVLLFISIFSKSYNNKSKVLKIFISSVFVLLTIILYKYSFTAINVNMASKNITDNNILIDEIISEKYSDNTSEIIPNDKTISYSDEEILKILKISHIYAELIEVHGEQEVINAMREHLSATDLANNRLLKVTNAKIENKNSDLLTHLVGSGYSRFEKNDYDLETDLDAIYYYYGYVGFALYMTFILYFCILAIIKLVKDLSIIRNGEYIILCYLIPLLVYGGQYSGAFLRKPNANIYLSLFLLLIYFNCKNKPNTQIKNNKISFLLLHLGYGGIESATINTANALVDKYEIELISFYKLKNNQANMLNKNIKVKYLYNGEPNRNEFMQSVKNKKIIAIFKEGIKAVNILLKKEILIINEIKNSDAKAIVSTRVEFSTLLSEYGSKDIIKIAQEHHYHNDNKKYINKLKYQYKNIDYLCALTKGLKTDYEKFLVKNKHTKIILLPNMIESVSKKSTLESKNIISVGRLHEGKRIDELVTIFSKLKNQKAKLFIIGTGEEENKIKDLIKKYKLQKRVIMLGYLDFKQQEKYYLNSCIFAMTSVTEGLPMVLLEAMNHGLPCIAYDLDNGVKDIINDKNGYIIKDRNEIEYVETLDKVLNENLNKKSIEVLNTASKYYKENVIKIWNKILEQ